MLKAAPNIQICMNHVLSSVEAIQVPCLAQHPRCSVVLAEEATGGGGGRHIQTFYPRNTWRTSDLRPRQPRYSYGIVMLFLGYCRQKDMRAISFSGFRKVSPIAPVVIERRLQARLIRQDVLTSNSPLELDAIVDESVLQRQRGDRAVMYEQQLQHLAEAARLPNVTLRVLPLSGPKVLALESFSVIRFGKAHETQLHDVVSTEWFAGLPLY